MGNNKVAQLPNISLLFKGFIVTITINSLSSVQAIYYLLILLYSAARIKVLFYMQDLVHKCTHQLFPLCETLQDHTNAYFQKTIRGHVHPIFLFLRKLYR